VGERGDEAIETAVLAGHEQYGGEYEILIGPTNGAPSDSGSGSNGPSDGEGNTDTLYRD
jgi:hypothetical protein